MLEAFINILKSASLTDWLMVFVTAIYVILTSRIMRANKTSADIAKKQLEDSQKQLEEAKRQNEEARRLEFMPYLQLQKYKVPPEKTNKYVPHVRELLFDARNEPLAPIRGPESSTVLARQHASTVTCQRPLQSRRAGR